MKIEKQLVPNCSEWGERLEFTDDEIAAKFKSFAQQEEKDEDRDVPNP